MTIDYGSAQHRSRRPNISQAELEGLAGATGTGCISRTANFVREWRSELTAAQQSSRQQGLHIPAPICDQVDGHAWVARQHGHSVRAMLEVYAAWADGAVESAIFPGTARFAGPGELQRLALDLAAGTRGLHLSP